MALKATDEVTSTWNEMADEKTDNNWIMTTVVGKEITLVGAGNKGFAGLKEHLENSQNQVQFGVFRVWGVDDRHKNVDVVRRTPKWVFLKFLGRDVSFVKKAKVANHATAVKETSFDGAGLSISFDGSEDLDGFSMRSVAEDLLNMGGAHKPVYYDFGPDQRFNLEEILGASAACLQAEGVIMRNYK